MSKRREKILYVSDSEETEYSEDNSDMPDTNSAQPDSAEPVSEPPVPKTCLKVEGVRARDLQGKRDKNFHCQYCGRPFAVKTFHSKHEDKCPVRLKRDAEWARHLAETQKDIVKKTERKQAYQAKKMILEASRPVEEVVVTKKRGPKPKPKKVVVYESSSDEEEEESEYEEPAPIRQKTAKPRPRPQPRQEPVYQEPVYQQPPPPRYILKF